jgi:hypothetical protein
MPEGLFLWLARTTAGISTALRLPSACSQYGAYCCQTIGLDILNCTWRRPAFSSTTDRNLPSDFNSRAALSLHQTCCPQRIFDYFPDAVDRSNRRLRPSSPGNLPVPQEWSGDRRELCVVLARSFCFLVLTRSRRQAPEASNTLRRRDVGIEHIRSDRATSVGTGIRWRPVTHPGDRIFFDSVPPIAVRPDAPLVDAYSFDACWSGLPGCEPHATDSR